MCFAITRRIRSLDAKGTIVHLKQWPASAVEGGFKEEMRIGGGSFARVKGGWGPAGGVAFKHHFLSIAARAEPEIPKPSTTTLGVKWDRHLVEAAARELHALQSLCPHTSIIQWVEAFLSPCPAAVVFVYERALGDLRQFVGERVRLSTSQLQELCGGMVAGLQHMHEHHFIHRDLSWSNMLICLDPSSDLQIIVKLADFGQSLELVPGTNPGPGDREELETLRTTLLFAPPELLAAQGPYTYAADCWSMGMLILCCSQTTCVQHPLEVQKSLNSEEAVLAAIKELQDFPCLHLH